MCFVYSTARDKDRSCISILLSVGLLVGDIISMGLKLGITFHEVKKTNIIFLVHILILHMPDTLL